MELLLALSLQIAEVRLDLAEEAPGPRALGRQQAPAVPQATVGPPRHGAQEVQVSDQRLWRGRVWAQRGARRVLGDAEHE